MDDGQLPQMPERAAGRGAAQRARGDAMLEKAEQILKPVVAAILATEEGRKVLMAEATALHRIAFVLSIGGFYLLALIRRVDFAGFVSPAFIDDCLAFLRVQMFMSIFGIFMHDKLPWITYMPLVFLIVLLVRALVRVYKRRQGLNNEDAAAEMNE